ncbi:MAG: MATE family efflux transporter [Armatimonadota bacterium]|nr:MATE family efflux transporter [Armatimonadota bacterium]MDR7455990.1 MATE family efflux transporter [Armatimonadota bacterium]MDR7495973.1 MATE family efflux transporter [Armatimonadota bacterium]MDR7511667.1 MATE family efflux transporter [Armatimonadota bacterium]
MRDSAHTPPADAAVPAPTVRGLVRLAWPVVISRASQVVVGVTDAIMVAHLGEVAIAATTTGAANAFNLLILPMGLVFIVASFSSQFTGEGDPAGARRYGWYGLGVALLAQAACLAAIAGVPGALQAIGYRGEVYRLMSGYLQIRLLTGGAAIGIEALAAYYGGLGNTRLPMAVSLSAMALNVFGNWVFIYGHLGAPALGVRGAALASALATAAGFALFLGLFLGGVGTPRVATRIHLVWAEFGRTLRFGFPVGVNWFVEFLAFSFFINVLVAGLGTTTLAALMIVIQINAVSFMPAFGIASAGAILVGQALGAQQYRTVPQIVRLTAGVAGAWQGTVGLGYLLAPGLFMAPFVDGRVATPELLAIGTGVLMLSAGWQLFDSVGMTLSEALRAAGDTAFPMWARVAIAWAIFVPGTYVSLRVLGGGYTAATLWLVAYLALLAVVLALRFNSGAWRRIDLTGGRLT